MGIFTDTENDDDNDTNSARLREQNLQRPRHILPDLDDDERVNLVQFLKKRSIKAIADEVSFRFANKIEAQQVGSIGKAIAFNVVKELENQKHRKEKAEHLRK